MSQEESLPEPPESPNNIKFNCDECGQSISAYENMKGTKQCCPNCQNEFLVPGEKDDDFSFLQWVEGTLIKMIIGVPKFIFIIVPQKIIAFLERSFPWLVRMVRIIFLFCIWLGIIFWPFLLTKAFKQFNDYTGFLSIDIQYKWYTSFCIIWVLLASIGSLWGIAHVVRKRRRKKIKTKKANPKDSFD